MSTTTSDLSTLSQRQIDDKFMAIALAEAKKGNVGRGAILMSC